MSTTTTLSSSWRTRRKVCQPRRRGSSSRAPSGSWTPVPAASWASTTGSPSCCRASTPSARGACLPPSGAPNPGGTPRVRSTTTNHVRTHVWCHLSVSRCSCGSWHCGRLRWSKDRRDACWDVLYVWKQQVNMIGAYHLRCSDTFLLPSTDQLIPITLNSHNTSAHSLVLLPISVG